MGIEPTYPAWKAGVLPLNYTRMCDMSQQKLFYMPYAKMSIGFLKFLLQYYFIYVSILSKHIFLFTFDKAIPFSKYRKIYALNSNRQQLKRNRHIALFYSTVNTILIYERSILCLKKIHLSPRIYGTRSLR